MNNRSVPVSTVLPLLVYRDIDEAADWLGRAFGFKEHFRYGKPVAGSRCFWTARSSCSPGHAAERKARRCSEPKRKRLPLLLRTWTHTSQNP